MLDMNARKGRIGCSQIADIIGVGYGNALSVYNCIKGISEIEQNFRMLRGEIFEPAILELWQRTTGLLAYKPEGNIFNSQYDWLVGSPDAYIKGRDKGIEIKSSSTWVFKKSPKYDWRDAVPEKYQLQVQGYLMLTGFETWELVADVNSDKLYTWTIERDERMIINIDIICSHFYHHHLLTNIAPE